MKRIIIPTDFSITALNAAFYIFKLFKNQDIKYYLVHTYQIPYTMPEIAPIGGEIIQQQLQEILDKEVTKIKRFTKYSKLNISPVLKYGYAGITIKELVSKLKIDLVMLGTTGASGLREVVFGSIANDISSAINCPALVVPKNAELNTPKNILFTADFIAMQDKNILTPLVEIASQNESFVQILNMYNTEDDGDVEKKGIDFFKVLSKKNIAHSYKLSVQHNSIESSILEYINQNETDLLVVVKRHYDFLNKIFHHSVTKRLTFHTTTPILILHDSA